MLHGVVRIIPVIDLMSGQVVRGIGGDRKRYAPVKSCLARDPSPKSVARSFAERLTATDVYVADLDAINGSQPDWDSLDQIGECGVRVWLDCGIGTQKVADAVRTQSSNRPYLDRFVVGLESVCSTTDLAAISATIGSERSIFSLDLKQGRPLSRASDLTNLSPLDIAKTARHSGFEKFLVLDLAFVGESRGVGVVTLCQKLRSLFPEVEVIAGGGIRSTADVQKLADAGCNGVLVASALHNGLISCKDIDSFGSQAANL